MKHGATTIALMAAMLCGLGVFGAPVSASESARPEAEVSVAANGDPQKNPQKNPHKIMEAMRVNPSQGSAMPTGAKEAT